MEKDILRHCRRAAVLSDIHANFHAFRACYADAIAHGADCFIFLGDYVSDLADPRGTLDLVYEIRGKYPTVCLRGNRERYMLEQARGGAPFAPGSKTGSLLYTYRSLRPEDLAFFESLPIWDCIELNGISFEIAHAVKEDDRYYFDSTDPRIGNVFAKMDNGYLLSGHAHKQYICREQGKTILNPGSVGVPRGHGHLCQYAIVDATDQEPHFELYQLSYDVRAMIRRQFECGLTDLAPHWAVSVLYDVITGEEYTMKLLERVHRSAAGDDSAVHDERLWHTVASEMGMKFTEAEILRFFEDRIF